MSNMSYCRHENTAKDLADILDEWHNFEASEAEDSEIAGRKQVVRLCMRIIKEFIEEQDYTSDLVPGRKALMKRVGKWMYEWTDSGALAHTQWNMEE